MSARKYRNVPTMLDGQRFDSKGEAKRFAELQVLQRGKQIQNLERQVTYALFVNGVLVGKVRPDFRYVENGRTVCEDFKGKRTRDWATRWKLAKTLYGDIEWRVTSK